jgi:hypothetical protein
MTKRYLATSDTSSGSGSGSLMSGPDFGTPGLGVMGDGQIRLMYVVRLVSYRQSISPSTLRKSVLYYYHNNHKIERKHNIITTNCNYTTTTTTTTISEATIVSIFRRH